MSSQESGGGVSRRDLLRGGGAFALVTTSLGGCGFFSTEPTGSSSTPAGKGAAAGKGKEAPMLATRVQAGKLPPIEQRVPAKPLVLQPVERVGVYGGTWRTALLGPADNAWLGRTVGYECLMRWTPDGKAVVANIAESITPSEDFKQFTIKLRAGMKWSDGAPFTADDLMFAFDDVILNAELTPVVPEVLRSGDTPAKLEKVDETTLRLSYTQPNGLFLERMAIVLQGDLLIGAPKHYLQKFHVKYAPDVGKAAKAAGFASWVQYYQKQADTNWASVELPTLRPFVTKTPLGKGSRVVVERNPYSWKTDPEGAQLPYIDRIVYDVISDPSVILLKATNGEIDFHTRHINTLPNKPVLARNRAKGKYDFVTLKSTQMNEMLISLNLNHKNPALRQVFQNRDFRIGLSHAIDRPQLVAAVFQRQGVPWQAAPIQDSEYYDEEFATQFTKFDLALANTHLDKAGYRRRDRENYRLRPDGARIVINVDIATPALVPFWTDAMQLVIRNWRQVGIQARVQSRDRSLFFQRRDAGEHDATVWVGDGGYGVEMFSPAWYLPMGSEFAGQWGKWHTTSGKEGEKPPEPSLRQIQLYRQILVTADAKARTDLFRQILTIAKEQFYLIGTIRIAESYGIVRGNFHNVPKSMPEAAAFGTPALTNPEQYFIA